MKRVFGTLAFLSFFWLLGLVGAIEQNMMALGTGTLYMVIALALFYVFCKLAGAFYPPQKRKSRRRECSPIHGKRKSSILLYQTF